LEAIQEVGAHRGWNLLAAHVPSNHVHTVVEAEVPPERVMSDFKAYGQPPSESDGPGWTEPEAMGTPWQHTVVMETTARLGGQSVYRLRAG
jgi:REP element-mobilizing transposase RayT